ncbi:hypothetical protein PC128_g1256 [Phytophthora cactorum]|nr:hypothetical protein PC128_g1256 [Phytophthora cactorum]
MDPTTKLSAAPAHCEPKEIGIEYRAAIGALMYMATSTRPDLAYPVGYLSRFVDNPTVQHGGALKRVIRYLVTTSNLGILFKRPDGNPSRNLETITIDGYCDSDWGNCPDTCRSITGYSLMIAGGPVAWAARRQSVVAQSNAEAEYVASCEACMVGKSLIDILTEAVPHKRVEFTLGVDNQAAIALASNPTYSRKTRHIELRFHYVREQVKKHAVKIWKIAGDLNPADLLTKPLGFPRLAKLKTLFRMKPDLLQTGRELRRAGYQDQQRLDKDDRLLEGDRD